VEAKVERLCGRGREVEARPALTAANTRSQKYKGLAQPTCRPPPVFSFAHHYIPTHQLRDQVHVSRVWVPGLAGDRVLIRSPILSVFCSLKSVSCFSLLLYGYCHMSKQCLSNDWPSTFTLLSSLASRETPSIPFPVLVCICSSRSHLHKPLRKTSSSPPCADRLQQTYFLALSMRQPMQIKLSNPILRSSPDNSRY
jgi:hypothetical protein